MRPDRGFLDRRGTSHVDDKTRDQITQIEAVEIGARPGDLLQP